jgi:hypothetical protein
VKGAFEDKIRQSLRRVTDYVAVEEDAWVFLARSYPALVPFVGGHDQGRDGVVLDVGGGRLGVVSVSVEPGWESKLKRDIAKARTSATPPDVAILCTVQRVTAAKVGTLESELGMPILPHAEDWWVSELAKEDLQTRDIRRRLVDVGPRGLPALMTPDEYALLLGRRLAFVDVPLVGRDVELEALLERTRPGVVLVVVGAPGIGKSRFLIEAARRLGTGAAFVRPHADAATTLVGEYLTGAVGTLLLDDAHQYPTLLSTEPH